MALTNPSSTRSRLLRACYSFLVPVARFLLRNGVSFQEFDEIARVAFVEVAGKDYGLRGRQTNVSRVSAMTGIPRKEVRRLRELVGEYPRNPRIELSPLSDVLHRWFTDRRYLGRGGRPRKLKYRGRANSFEALVRECAGDVPVGAIKVELVRCGAVKVDAGGRLIAVRRHVIPQDLAEKVVRSMMFGLRGLASTIAFNSSSSGIEVGRIERFVESDPLTPAAIESMRAEVRRKIIVFSDGIDDFFSHGERARDKTGKRVGVGVYYYEDD